MYRWLPSVAMNAAGDIGIGYAVSSSVTYVSVAAAGQSAAYSGTGVLDSAETICVAGSGAQLGTARAGDYAATSIDPITDSFWHTNEVMTNTGNFQWNTYVCEFTVESGTGNMPPQASFTYSCTDLDCSFTDTSTDNDGTISSWSWSFGDGGTSTAQNPGHSYGAGGTYTVSLTVTDDGGASDSASQPVTVTAPGGGGITLTATGYKVKGRQKADLSWSGATSTDVDIYRDGTVITTTANDGAYTDNIDARGGGTYEYQLCEAGTSECSNLAAVVF
jgi:PKD repeat protein